MALAASAPEIPSAIDDPAALMAAQAAQPHPAASGSRGRVNERHELVDLHAGAVAPAGGIEEAQADALAHDPKVSLCAPPRDQLSVELVPGRSSLCHPRYARSMLWEFARGRGPPGPTATKPAHSPSPFFPKSYGLAADPR